MRVSIAVGVDCKYVEILDLTVSLPVAFGVVLIGYFYVMVYLGVSEQTKNN